MTTTRAVAALAACSFVLVACSSTTDGSGTAEPPRTSATSPLESPSETPTTAAESTPATSPAVSEPAESTIIAAPASPVRTVHVEAPSGATYEVKIWFDVRNDTCFDHAYGQPIITFLTKHPCRGLHRILATTTVKGRAVGFAESETGIPGTPSDPYVYASRFAELEQADGTGSLNDLLREGYRLPSGPTSIPSSEAFNVLGQDTGVSVWDVWYLDGPTPNNDPALITMTEDLFLQF